MESIRIMSNIIGVSAIILLVCSIIGFGFNLIFGLINDNNKGKKHLTVSFFFIVAIVFCIFILVTSTIVNKKNKPSEWVDFTYLLDNTNTYNLGGIYLLDLPMYPVRTDLINNDIIINMPYEKSHFEPFISEGLLLAIALGAAVLAILSVTTFCRFLVDGLGQYGDRQELIYSLMSIPFVLLSAFYAFFAVYITTNNSKVHTHSYVYYSENGIQYTDNYNEVIKEIVYRQDIVDMFKEKDEVQ